MFALLHVVLANAEQTDYSFFVVKLHDVPVKHVS